MFQVLFLSADAFADKSAPTISVINPKICVRQGPTVGADLSAKAIHQVLEICDET